MMLMWLHCNVNALYGYSHKISNNLFQMNSSPMGEFGVSFCCTPGYAVVQAVELPTI